MTGHAVAYATVGVIPGPARWLDAVTAVVFIFSRKSRLY
jgi:hypothetical protein